MKIKTRIVLSLLLVALVSWTLLVAGLVIDNRNLATFRSITQFDIPSIEAIALAGSQFTRMQAEATSIHLIVDRVRKETGATNNLARAALIVEQESEEFEEVFSEFRKSLAQARQTADAGEVAKFEILQEAADELRELVNRLTAGSPDSAEIWEEMEEIEDSFLEAHESLQRAEFQRVDATVFAAEARLNRFSLIELWLVPTLLIGSLLLAFGLARRITRPLADLERGLNNFREGEYASRLAVNGDDEIARTSMAFNQMAADIEQTQQRLQAASQAKSEFLSRMSHELRTPLNGILGFAQLLEMAELPDRSQKCVDRIGSAGRHLLDLINEVLDISRVEAGRLTISPEPVRIGEVVGEVVAMVMPMAAERRIRIEQPETDAVDIRARADRQRLKQVLMNLASNGIKYNREGGELTFAWAVEGERVRILVRDSGIGLAPDQTEKIFLPFERLDADQSGVEGTGLGLALTKRLVEAMDGSIGVESEPGTGSTFQVELPASSSVATQPSEDKMKRIAPADGNGSLTLLYIEDNPDNLRLVESILLHRPNMTLLSAIQGRIGIELARRHRPDLVLLDLDLPDVKGDQVLVDLKTHAATRDIPVYMLSADAMPSSVNRLKSMGAVDYLTKPLDVPDFLRLLDGLVKAKAAEDEEARA